MMQSFMIEPLTRHKYSYEKNRKCLETKKILDQEPSSLTKKRRFKKITGCLRVKCKGPCAWLVQSL